MIGNLGCALAINMGMFLALRAISAIGSSSVMSLGAGTIADVFVPKERGRRMAL